MDQKLSLRLPNDVFQNLREEASKHRISVSDVVRERILRGRNADLKQVSMVHEFSQLRKSTNRPDDEANPIEGLVKRITETDFAIFEILFLLREYLFERNGQILKKIDEKMERRFGKERTRIL